MENDLLQVDRLIQLLKLAEAGTGSEGKAGVGVGVGVGEREGEEEDNKRSALHQEIISLATEYLTLGPDAEFYRQRVKKAGYPVYPGEIDRFGWLTAYFQFKWGILLFG